jgi:serine/threonine protein phosphatase PrpC
MGTTLTVCYTTQPDLFVLHAGDSRACLYRGGNLRRLTRDHTIDYGGPDNVTVVLASYSIPEAADTADWAAPPG